MLHKFLRLISPLKSGNWWHRDKNQSQISALVFLERAKGVSNLDIRSPGSRALRTEPEASRSRRTQNLLFKPHGQQMAKLRTTASIASARLLTLSNIREVPNAANFNTNAPAQELQL